jgi:hypothetical protein
MISEAEVSPESDELSEQELLARELASLPPWERLEELARKQ